MPGSALEDRRVREVLAFISSHYARPLTREVLARRVNLSASRLHSLFRRHADTTPRAAIMAKRMETAAELLSTTHLLVKEVAARVGIQDDSHFVRDFAKFHGLSPTAYRQAHARGSLQIDSGRAFVPGAALDAKGSVQLANR